MDKKEQILRQRAIETAKKFEMKNTGEGIDVVCFMLEDEKYAIEVLMVSEVHTFVQPTPIPHTPPYITGIIYLRGRFVSVVDLKHFLGMKEKNTENTSSLLLLSDGVMEFAVTVDTVLEKIKLNKQIIQDIPSGFHLPRKELIYGITEKGTIMLDGKKLIADPEMKLYQEVNTRYTRREKDVQ